MRAILVGVFGFLFVCAASMAQDQTDDALISMRVKAALVADDVTKATQINVETHRGVVHLSGFVDSRPMRATAEQIARNIKGVIQIQNDLMLRDPDRTLGDAVADTVIAAKIKGELAGKAGFDAATRINVEVNSGVVALSGFLPDADDKARAAAIARTVHGVKDVRNDIAIEPNER